MEEHEPNSKSGEHKKKNRNLTQAQYKLKPEMSLRDTSGIFWLHYPK